MKKVITMLWLLWPLAVSPCLGQTSSSEGVDPDIGSESFMALAREAIRNLKPVRVHGRVVDQTGDPVVGAAVDIHWQAPNLLQPLNPGNDTKLAITDENGFWDYTVLRGGYIYIQDVEKSGYEFHREMNEYYRDPSQKYFERRSSSAPLILTMRKKGECSLLLKPRMPIYMFRPPSKAYAMNLVTGHNVAIAEGDEISREVDIVVKAARNEDATWTLTFEPQGEHGGILIDADADKTYVAPEGGYEQSVEIEMALEPHRYVPNFMDKEKSVHFWVRSGSPQIYSRCAIWLYIEEGVEECRMDWREITVNPYGERIMEFEKWWDGHYLTKRAFLNVAEAALAEGRLPEKPDLEAVKAAVAAQKK
ncbi:MAG: hypothetical protein KJ626_06660 [Verrucomicrobia bacterium]|nr:hypothetical protein [Verrucomicrobiota bacterium]